MPRHVTLVTGARLHFGPLAVGAVAGRSFGGIGVMVDRPGYRLKVTRCEQDEIIAGDASDRVRRILATLRGATATDHGPRTSGLPPCRLEVVDSIPAHQGFGSGTQLALAVARGYRTLQERPDVSAVELAQRVGRGRRSAVGIHGFERGGFIVDAGKRTPQAIGELACRTAVPETWRFVLVTPTDRRGISDEFERSAFARLPPMPPAVTDRLCRIVIRELLPALEASDCEAFGGGLTEFGRTVGEYFRPVQGGVYAHPGGAGIAETALAAGACGVAQTSWGPTLCALAGGQHAADALAARLRHGASWDDARLRVAAPLNHGASIEIAAS